MNRTVLLLAVALLLSLGLNLLQWLAAPSPEAREGQAATSGDAGIVVDTTEEEDETSCWVELADCRADEVEESAEVATVFTHHDSAVLPSADATEPSGNVPSRPGPREVDDEFQEEVLCTIALDSLRREWEEQREDTIANLRRSLADDDERGAMLDRDVARAQQLFQIADADRAAFEADYRRLWGERVSDFQEALGEEPPDSAAAFEVVKSLFEDEDSLVTERFGDDGRRRLRVAQAERRTAVLALLAVHAGAEWDDAITW